MDRVRVGSQELAFRRMGTGPPLVLLHGGVCDSRVWRRALDDLADEHTVIAWDAPGCGESSDPAGSFRLGEYADCLAGLLDALDVEHPHVLGHSWGSALALELYRRHPEVAASLVLAGPYAGWAGSLPPDEVEARLAMALEVADGLSDVSAFVLEGADPELAGIMAEARPAATRAMAHALAEADLRDVLPTIAVPTLVVRGEADVRSSAEVAEAIHAAIPGSVLRVLRGASHELFLDDPEGFAQEVRRFVRGR